MTERIEVPNPVTRPLDPAPRSRTDERGYTYTTLSDRGDVGGLIWDSEMLNWTLFEMAVRLGRVERTPDQSATIEVGDLGEFVEEFLAKFDHYEELLCTCGEEFHPVDTTNTGDNNKIIKQEK